MSDNCATAALSSALIGRQRRTFNSLTRFGSDVALSLSRLTHDTVSHTKSKSGNQSAKRARSMDPGGHFALVALSALLLVCCWARPETKTSHHLEVQTAPPVKAVDSSEIVVIVTWDGVRWQEVIHGIDPQLERQLGKTVHQNHASESLLPNLNRLAGTEGILLGDDNAPIFASSPSTVSLPGYSEIFSGRSPICANNDCPATKQPTLLDDWLAARKDASMAVVTSWSRIPRAAARNLSPIAVSAGRNLVVRREQFCDSVEPCRQLNTGKRVSAWPGADDYRPDRATAGLALSYLQTHSPQFLFIGLGDTDEYAHRGDYDGYLESLHFADETLGAVWQWLHEQQLRGHHTLLIVTADHGRSSTFTQHSSAPEAARVWALLAGSGVTARGHIAATPSRLADIAPTVRAFLGLHGDSDPSAGLSLFRKFAADATLTSVTSPAILAAKDAPSASN